MEKFFDAWRVPLAWKVTKSSGICDDRFMPKLTETRCRVCWPLVTRAFYLTVVLVPFMVFGASAFLTRRFHSYPHMPDSHLISTQAILAEQPLPSRLTRTTRERIAEPP